MKKLFIVALLLLASINVSASEIIDKSALKQITNHLPLIVMCTGSGASSKVYFTSDDARTIFWYAEQNGLISHNYTYTETDLDTAIRETKSTGEGCVVALSRNLHNTLREFGFYVLTLIPNENMPEFTEARLLTGKGGSVVGLTIRLK